MLYNEKFQLAFQEIIQNRIIMMSISGLSQTEIHASLKKDSKQIAVQIEEYMSLA